MGSKINIRFLRKKLHGRVKSTQTKYIGAATCMGCTNSFMEAWDPNFLCMYMYEYYKVINTI